MDTDICQVIPLLMLQQCCKDRVTLHYQFGGNFEATRSGHTMTFEFKRERMSDSTLPTSKNLDQPSGKGERRVVQILPGNQDRAI